MASCCFFPSLLSHFSPSYLWIAIHYHITHTHTHTQIFTFMLALEITRLCQFLVISNPLVLQYLFDILYSEVSLITLTLVWVCIMCMQVLWKLTVSDTRSVMWSRQCLIRTSAQVISRFLPSMSIQEIWFLVSRVCFRSNIQHCVHVSLEEKWRKVGCYITQCEFNRCSMICNSKGVIKW